MQGGDFDVGGGETYSLFGEGCAICSPHCPAFSAQLPVETALLLSSAAVAPTVAGVLVRPTASHPLPAFISPLSLYVTWEGIESPPQLSPPWPLMTSGGSLLTWPFGELLL